MKVAIALESPHLSPRARALAVARKLAAGGDVVAAACLMDGAADGPALAARLGLREAYFVADAALAKTGSRGRAQAIAGLLTRVRVDLILVDAAADGGGGLFSASLAHLGNMSGLFRVRDIERDTTAPDAIVAVVDVAGKRHRLRLDLPAVLSVSGEAPALPAIQPAQVRSRIYSLGELGLAADDLVREPIPGEAFVPASRRPQVVTTIDDLLEP
jgi:electron transfer flavoprotein alpha/beta subunit